MFFFSKKKLDPIIRLKLKEKTDKSIPVIILLKESPSNRFKNSISKNTGKLKHEYKYMHGLSAQLTLEQIDKLSELPEVISISYDRKANICMDKTVEDVGVNHSNPYGLTGRNVNVAVIDTGVFPHPDLIRPHRSIIHFKDFIASCGEPYDDNGHGTHVCGIISGSGSMSDGRFKGIAPDSRIIMLKAFNNVGEGAFSDILAAIGWVIENKEKYNIRLLCLPFGADSIMSYDLDPLCKACRAAIDSGIIVIAASGNKGPNFGTITTPGVEPSIITVGCCYSREPNIKDWKISDFSGRGSSKGAQTKPDIIAPGSGITSLGSDKSFFPGKGRKSLPESLKEHYCSMTGSSISTAVAAGCIALFLEKMPALTGKDLKGILKLSCQTLNQSKTAQGYGVISVKNLIDE